MVAALALAACAGAGNDDRGAPTSGRATTTSATAPVTTVATTSVAATSPTVPVTTTLPVTAATTSSTAGAPTPPTTTPDQAQPVTPEDAQRVLEAFPAGEDSPPFDPTLGADLERALNDVIADPAGARGFFNAVADGRPPGVISAPYLVCRLDTGGAPCVASIEDYRTDMGACSRPGVVYVRRLVVTEAGWAGAGVCSFVIDDEQLVRATQLMRGLLENSGSLLTEDPELQQLAGEWAVHRSEQREPIEAPTTAAGREFVRRLRQLSNAGDGLCGSVGLASDPFTLARLNALNPLSGANLRPQRIGIGAAPGAGRISLVWCAVPA